MNFDYLNTLHSNIQSEYDKFHELVEKGMNVYANTNTLPKKTGQMSKDFTYHRLDYNTGMIIFGADSPQAVFLNEGTVAHDIRNSFGKGEEFGIGGKEYGTRYIEVGDFHPGVTKYVGFVGKNLVPNLARTIRRVWNNGKY